MGEYFLAVNPKKRQFVHPYVFGNDNKRGDVFDAYCGTALELLLTDSKAYESIRPLDEVSPLRLVGLWLGDPVIIAGDDYGVPNPAGFRTTTDAEPTRNLHDMARQEFEDISYHALAMLCASPKSPIYSYGIEDRDLFFSLAVVAKFLNQREVADVLREHHGDNWEGRLGELLRKEYHWKQPRRLDQFIRDINAS